LAIHKSNLLPIKEYTRAVKKDEGEY